MMIICFDDDDDHDDDDDDGHVPQDGFGMQPSTRPSPTWEVVSSSVAGTYQAIDGLLLMGKVQEKMIVC